MDYCLDFIRNLKECSWLADQRTVPVGLSVGRAECVCFSRPRRGPSEETPTLGLSYIISTGQSGETKGPQQKDARADPQRPLTVEGAVSGRPEKSCVCSHQGKCRGQMVRCPKNPTQRQSNEA